MSVSKGRFQLWLRGLGSGRPELIKLANRATASTPGATLHVIPVFCFGLCVCYWIGGQGSEWLQNPKAPG